MLPHRAHALYTPCADSHALQATALLNVFKTTATLRFEHVQTTGTEDHGAADDDLGRVPGAEHRAHRVGGFYLVNVWIFSEIRKRRLDEQYLRERTAQTIHVAPAPPPPPG